MGVIEWQRYEAKTKGITEKSAKITENALEQIHIQINKAVRISQVSFSEEEHIRPM